MSGGPPLVFLVAGEPSGDLLGAGLMTALRELTGGKIAFAGVGGERMTDAGLDSLFPMSELSTMGLVEVLPRVPRLYRRLRRTAAVVRDLRPAVVVTIDSPGFNTPLARRLQGIDAPLIHYVAPTVWAWRAARAKTLARLYDRLLALLPFEPPLFEREGLPCVWVGHPAAAAAAPDGAGFRARRGVAPDAPPPRRVAGQPRRRGAAPAPGLSRGGRAHRFAASAPPRRHRDRPRRGGSGDGSALARSAGRRPRSGRARRRASPPRTPPSPPRAR